MGEAQAYILGRVVGPKGDTGPQGPPGPPGLKGDAGEPGQTVFEIARANGFTGTEEEYKDLLSNIGNIHSLLSQIVLGV